MFKKKSNFYSGILSIILICLILTIFEIIFFYVVAKPEISNSINKVINNLDKILKNDLILENEEFNCSILKKNKNYYVIKNNLSNLFYEYELNMKKNNKNIIINIVFIIVIILFWLFYIVEILFYKSSIKGVGIKKNIDWSFIPSTGITILLILLFQIHFYFNISKKYKYVSGTELLQLIKKKINQNYDKSNDNNLNTNDNSNNNNNNNNNNSNNSNNKNNNIKTSNSNINNEIVVSEENDVDDENINLNFNNENILNFKSTLLNLT